MALNAFSLRCIRSDLASIRQIIADSRRSEPGLTMQAICLDHAQRLADRIETELARVESAGTVTQEISQ